MVICVNNHGNEFEEVASLVFMTSQLSTNETQAFEQLLVAWNAHQELRAAAAPFDSRVTAREQVIAARTNLRTLRSAA